MAERLHRRVASMLGKAGISSWDVVAPAVVNGTGVETKYSDYMTIPDPKPTGVGLFAVPIPQLSLAESGSLVSSVQFADAADNLISEANLPSLSAGSDVATASAASVSTSGSITGAGASGTVTGSWISSTLGTYDPLNKYVLSTFFASVHAYYGGIPAAEVTASITGIDIEFADSAYNVLKTVSITCSLTSHDVPAGGGVYGETDGTISLSLPSLELLASWTGTIAYARMKIHWSYDHAFGSGTVSGTVSGGATFTKVVSETTGAEVLSRAVVLPTTSVTATSGTVTNTFAASVPAGSWVTRYRNVIVNYSYKGGWAPVAPSAGNSTGCGSVAVSSDYLHGSTSISLTAAAGLTACTQLSSTVKNIRDSGTLTVSSGIEEYYSQLVYAATDEGTDLPRLHVVDGGAEGQTIAKMRYKFAQTIAAAGMWTGTPVGTKLYQLPVIPT